MNKHLDKILGHEYVLKDGERITLQHMESHQHPIAIGKNEIGVYVLLSKTQGINTFILSQHCKRYLRPEALPDSIREKLAWAMVQEPKDPYGEVLPKDRYWNDVPEGEMGMRIDNYRCVVFLTRNEFYWLHSDSMQMAEADFLAHGKVLGDMLSDSGSEGKD